MGMFDYVRYWGLCPKCGEAVDEWQSKDGPCTLEVLEASRVDRFYGICDNCHTFIEVKTRHNELVRGFDINRLGGRDARESIQQGSEANDGRGQG